MRWSATRLRWVLLGGVFLLAAVVAGFFGLARYRAGKIWQHILARNGVNLRRESNGVTWSQSSKGRTIFTLHASKAVPEGNNKYALHDAVLILYGREPGRDDRIYGSQFEYDQEQGIARALGEVHMDLQAPEPGGKAPAAGATPDLSFGTEDSAATDPAVIHVRTSGLVYMRKLGIAATGDPAEFRYRGITCTSRGAEFDTEHSQIRLLAEVKLTGQMRGAPFTLSANHAELDRTDETANLVSPVMVSGDRSARAAHALFHLHKDGTLQAAEATGGVELRSGTQTVAAPQLAAVFGTGNRPQQARLLQGVKLTDVDAAKPAHGAARTLDLNWDGDGELQALTAEGAVSYDGVARGASGGTEERQMQAERAEASFGRGARKRALLQRVHLIGGAEIASANKVPGGAVRGSAVKVIADELTAAFAVDASGRTVARSMDGAGHTRLEQVAADGGRQQSKGDALQVAFAPRAGTTVQGEEVSSAVQSGHVEVENWAAPKAGEAAGDVQQTTGHASKAIYAAGDGTLTLSGAGGEHASVQQPGSELVAEQIVLHQGSGDAEAAGSVAVTSAGRSGSPATHVLASRARLLHEAKLSEFYGEALRPAQLWQAGSQVQADEITLDGISHGMAARPKDGAGRVHAVFAAQGGRDKAGRPGDGGTAKTVTELGRPGGTGVAGANLPEAERDSVQVSAERMDYDDAHHQALFVGDVRLTGAVGEVIAERGAAFLKPASAGAGAKTKAGEGMSPGVQPDLGGSLERLVLLGNVKLRQPGRTGFGEQLTYTAATDSFALTGTPGKPPHVVGEQGSEVTGATLLFRGSDSTIVVAGSHGDPQATGPKRVHTETDLKQ